MANIQASQHQPHQQTQHQQQQQQAQQSNHVIYMAANPQTHLDELFKVVDDKSSKKIQNSVPMRERRLPDSFFRPPSASSSASHSRDSSYDSSSQFNSTPATTTTGTGTGGGGGGGRSTGKPPTPLGNTTPSSPMSPMALGVQSPGGHQNQNSSNNNNNNRVKSSFHVKAFSLPTSLPAQMYQKYVNDLQTKNNSNNNNDNNSSRNFEQLIMPQQSVINNNKLVPSQHNINSNNLDRNFDINKIPLPDGWAMSYDENTGDPYYLNHKLKTTTWEDPRSQLSLGSMAHLSISNPNMSQTHQPSSQQETMIGYSSHPNISNNNKNSNNQQVVNNNNPSFPHCQDQIIQQILMQQQQQQQQPSKLNSTNLTTRQTSMNYPIYSNLNDIASMETATIENDFDTEFSAIDSLIDTNNILNNNNNNNNANMADNVAYRFQSLDVYQEEIQKYRSRGEQVLKERTLQKDYAPQIGPYLTSSNMINGDNNNNNNNHSRQESQDSGLGSGHLMLHSDIGADLFSDPSLTRISDQLSFDPPTFQSNNLLDLDGDLEEFLNSTNNDLSQQTTMTWHV